MRITRHGMLLDAGDSWMTGFFDHLAFSSKLSFLVIVNVASFLQIALIIFQLEIFFCCTFDFYSNPVFFPFFENMLILTHSTEYPKMAPVTETYFEQALHYIFPGKCFEELVVKLDVTHAKCAPLVLSRCLGVAITLGSTFLLVPQILKIYSAKSGRGISLWAQVLGLIAAAANAAYSYEKKFVFGQWGDTLFVAIQMVFIIMQILWYGGAQAYAFAFMATCWCAAMAIAYHHVPMYVLEALQTVAIPIIFISKGIQVVSNYRQRSTGQLSVLSVAMQLGGCLARIFTSFQASSGDLLVLAPYLIAALLNGIIFAQIFYYGSGKVKEGGYKKLSKQTKKSN
uniref:Mannose-P-dolichol utilization defect 1 protein homolog n=1 Tax=Ditylenchus dipsaci TaxID=166011 RepID=A0A915E0Q5_9BILA